MTIDDYIVERNRIQLAAENQEKGAECWTKLGVANRHIDRVLTGQLELTPAVEDEIIRCLNEAQDMYVPEGGA